VVDSVQHDDCDVLLHTAAKARAQQGARNAKLSGFIIVFIMLVAAIASAIFVGDNTRQLHLNIRILKYTNWYFRLVSGKVFLGPPGHLNMWNPIYLDIQFDICIELVFHTTSGASWSGPPSTYLNVVTRC